MSTVKSPLKYQKLLKLALISAGISLVAATSTIASIPTTNINPANSELVNQTAPVNIPLQIAQSFALCSDPEGDFVPRVWAETKDFLVNICYYVEGGHGKYYGRAKTGGASISVPLQSERNGRYVAVNGDTRYILTRNELIVTQGKRTLLRQKVVRFYVK